MTPQRPRFDERAFAPLPGGAGARVSGPASRPTAPVRPPEGAPTPPPAVAPEEPEALLVDPQVLLRLPRILRHAIAARAERLPPAPLAGRQSAETGYELWPGTGESLITALRAS